MTRLKYSQCYVDSDIQSVPNTTILKHNPLNWAMSSGNLRKVDMVFSKKY